MKKIFDLSKYEVLEQHYAKLIYWVVVALVAFTFFVSWSQSNLIKTDSDSFVQIQRSYKNAGIDTKQALNKKYTVQSKGNQVSISNDLKYTYVKVQNDIAAMQPQNGINQILGSSMFIIFPLIMMIYAISTAYFDLNNRTLKVKVTHSGIQPIVIAKLFGLFLSAFITLTILCVAFEFFQFGFRSLESIPTDVPINYTMINGTSYLSSAPIQFLSTLVLACLMITISYYLTLLIRSSILPMIMVGVYYLLIPTLGRFDYKQNIILLYSKLFRGTAVTYTPAPVGGSFSFISFAICVITLVISIVIMNYVITRKGFLTRKF